MFTYCPQIYRTKNWLAFFGPTSRVNFRSEYFGKSPRGTYPSHRSEFVRDWITLVWHGFLSKRSLLVPWLAAAARVALGARGQKLNKPITGKGGGIAARLARGLGCSMHLLIRHRESIWRKIERDPQQLQSYIYPKYSKHWLSNWILV